MARRKTLDRWIHEALTDPEKDAKCSAIALLHLVGMQTKEVYSVKIGGTSAWEPKALADLFNDKATAFCQDMPGVQQFNLIAFYGGKAESEAAHHFVINNVPAEGGLGTEPPTEMGQKMQTMRQTEMVFQAAYRKQAHLDEMHMRVIEQQSRMLNDMMVRYKDAFDVLEKMRIAQLDGDHTRRMVELEYQRKSDERKKLMEVGPALINTIAGQEIFPQSTADTALIEAFIEGIVENGGGDMSKIAGIVPPALLGPLAARIEQHMNKKAKLAEETTQLARYTGPPEKDVVGGAE